MNPSVAPRRASLLAFDTSTEIMSVAVQGREQAWRSNEPGGALASARLLPCVDALLVRAGMRLGDVDAIAFGRGPGAFTGLRTSCAVAQGLAFGAARPVIAIDSLLLAAEDARWQSPDPTAPVQVGVAMDARMDEVYAGVYRWTGSAWQVQTAAALYTLPALLHAWAAQMPDCVAGSAPRAFGARWSLPAAICAAGERDRAAALLRLAQWDFDAGRLMDAAAALPVYLRDKVALTTRERDVVRAAKAKAGA